MKIFENVDRFLTKQKEHMLRLDEAEGLRKREDSGYDFSLKEENTGRRIGMREILYENTIQWIRSEASKILLPEMMQLSMPGVLNEDVMTTAFPTFTTSLLPAVRRIYSQLMAMQLVSVQPQMGPTGYIWWMDFVYGTAINTNAPAKGDRIGDADYPTYSDSYEKGPINDLEMTLKKKPITATTKKLKAGWTLEAQQDLNSQWKLDIWTELQPEVINQIAREIDRNLISLMLAGAGAGNVNWNANGYLSEDIKYTMMRKAYDESLYNAVIDAGAKIFKHKFVQPNWLLMNGDTFTRFAKMDKFMADPNLGPDQMSQIGWRYEGVLAGKYKIYVDPWFVDNKILLGYRGTDWKYACAYYAPYVPIFLSEEYIVNGDFTQRARGAMTRSFSGVIPDSDTDPLNYGLATVSINQS